MSSPIITNKPVALCDRPNFLPKHAGKAFLRYEMLAFDIMGKACQDYHGGMWDFFELSNGGFYMAPDSEKCFRLIWEDNWFDGELSADAAGIGVSLMAQSWLSSATHSESLAGKFHQLRGYAMQHAEASAIFGFID